MAWTEIIRPKHQRERLRYANDTTEEELAVIATRQRGLCGLLHRPELLPVAHAAQGLSAVHHGAVLVLSLAQRRHLAAHQPRAGEASGQAGRACGESAQAWLLIASVKLLSCRLIRT
jgi:hypothetical protein